MKIDAFTDCAFQQQYAIARTCTRPGLNSRIFRLLLDEISQKRIENKKKKPIESKDSHYFFTQIYLSASLQNILVIVYLYLIFVSYHISGKRSIFLFILFRFLSFSFNTRKIQNVRIKITVISNHFLLSYFFKRLRRSNLGRW